jgi:hypothetical protein
VKEIFAVVFIAAVGIFSILGGALNWRFFMESRKAAFFVRVFGPNGARIFYVLLGVVMVGIAIYLGLHPEEIAHSRRLQF